MEDRRIRKSKKALKDALCELVKTKPLADITITELCAKADINRMTFYKNFGTIKEVVKEIYYDYFEEMLDTLPPSYWECKKKESEIPVATIEFFKKNYERMAALTDNYNDKMFLGMLLEHYFENNGEEEIDIISKYRIFYDTIGSFTLLARWLADGCPISEIELAQLISSLSSREEIYLKEQ